MQRAGIAVWVEQDYGNQTSRKTRPFFVSGETCDELNSPRKVDFVDKPRLAIYKQMAGIPIVGGCSACKDVVFDGRFVTGPVGVHREKLENMFQEHYRGVHDNNDGFLKERPSSSEF